jgi:hypothetical protein
MLRQAQHEGIVLQGELAEPQQAHHEESSP